MTDSDREPIPIVTRAGLLTVPCPRHRVDAGTMCPGRQQGRVGCQVRLWLAQDVMHGRIIPRRDMLRYSGAVMFRYREIFTATLAAGTGLAAPRVPRPLSLSEQMAARAEAEGRMHTLTMADLDAPPWAED